jgi:3-hydroxypropionyl-coenzyme A dehydratase
MTFIETERLEGNNGIVIIKINRPEVLNAINVDVIAEFSNTIDAIGLDENIRAVIITGAGEKSFCAGADLRYVVNLSPIEAERYATTIHNLLNKIEGLPRPVIAAINGYALGGGCEIALACDIRIASSNAKIGQTEVKVGIPPGWGGTQRMLRLLRVSKAKELIYTGRMVGADEAFQIGLVNKVVNIETESEDGAKSQDSMNNRNKKSSTAEYGLAAAKLLNKKLIDECIELANVISKNSLNAVTISKMLINKALDVDISSGLELEKYGWSLCFAHEDRVKMMSAFLNKKIS